jgi:hypothetical protein
MRKAWICGGLAVMALVATADVLAQQQLARSPLKTLLQAEGISSNDAVTYRDASGHAMTPDAVNAAIQSGHSVSVEIDRAHHAAVIALENPAASQKTVRSSTAATASFHAVPSHMLAVGQPLPPFKLATVAGKMIGNDTLLGHTTLISFFFAQCAPCIAETPGLSAYTKRHPDRHVLAVTFDDAKTAKDFIAAHAFTWPVAADAIDFITDMGVNTFPTLAEVGPDGRLVKIALSSDIDRSATLTEADLERWVAASTPTR